MTNKNLDEMYEDACAQLTKAHNMIDALEKQVVMFRGLIVAALAEIKATGESEGVLFGADQQIDEKLEQALAATQDLSGLVLCDAEPVASVVGDAKGNFGALYVGLEPSTKLYKARKQP